MGASHNDNGSMFRFNGITWTEVFSNLSYNNERFGPMFVYGQNFYTLVDNSSYGGDILLYQFTENTSIIVTNFGLQSSVRFGPLHYASGITQPVVYNDTAYFKIGTRLGPKLYKFDGSVVTVVTNMDFDQLFVYNNNFYGSLDTNVYSFSSKTFTNGYTINSTTNNIYSVVQTNYNTTTSSTTNTMIAYTNILSTVISYMYNTNFVGSGGIGGNLWNITGIGLTNTIINSIAEVSSFIGNTNMSVTVVIPSNSPTPINFRITIEDLK